MTKKTQPIFYQKHPLPATSFPRRRESSQDILHTHSIFKSIIILLLSMILTTCTAHAAESETTVTALQEKYATMHSLKASFTQRLTHKESGAVEERTGTFSFKKPLFIRWEIVQPHKQVVVISDKDVWEYVPEEQVAYRFSPSVIQESGPLIDIITGQARLDTNFKVKSDGEQKDKQGALHKLILYPKEPGPQVIEAAVYVDAQNIIRRVVIVDFYGNTNDVRFAAVTPDAKLPAALFTFTPPKGVDVEDHRGKALDKGIFR